MFRVIGSNAGHPLEIRIGGHKLHVVATDGNPIKPIEADSLIVNGGERYDFYINTKGDDNVSNYFITVKTIETKEDNFNEILAENFGLAILKYKNADYSKITCSDACSSCNRKNKCIKVNCPFWPNENDGFYKCIPVNQFQSANIPDSDRELLKPHYNSKNFEEHFFNFHFSGMVTLRSSINGKRFMMPSIPPFFRSNSNSVLKECSPSCFSENESCECSHKLEIGFNKVIQFVLFNMGSGAGIEGNAHPIHLHGHNFYVIKMGFPSYFPNNKTYARINQDLNCRDDTQACSNGDWNDSSWRYGNVPKSNIFNPPIKDTISIPVGGYVVIRFKSNNLGYWMMHCHIDIHHGEGMAMIIQEGSSKDIANIVDYNNINVCENNLDYLNEFKNFKRETNRNIFVPIFEPIFKIFSNLFSKIT